MGRLMLVTGGARSGKSTFAEELVKSFGDDVLYIATSIPFDEEMKQRVKKHKAQRPAHWETVEAYKDMDVVLGERMTGKSAALLDCITVMATNLMMEHCNDLDRLTNELVFEIEVVVREEINKLISIVKTSDTILVAVSNEIGMGVVPEYKSARAFRDIAGLANQMLAKAADEVYFCVSGIPMKIK